MKFSFSRDFFLFERQSPIEVIHRNKFAKNVLPQAVQDERKTKKMKICKNNVLVHSR